MIAAFIHDHNFVFNPNDDQIYDGSGGAFDENLWKRYLQIFSSLIVIGRKVETLPNKLVVSSTENVEFSLIENLNSPKHRILNKSQIIKRLEAIISEVDFVIIRLPSTLGYWAFDICQKLSKKYILEIVGDPYEAYWNYGSFLGKLIAPIEALKLRSICKKAIGVIYVTQNYLQKKYPTDGLQESISNVRLQETSDAHSAISFYENPVGIFRIGLIGSFHVRYKGHTEALKAIQFLKNHYKITNFKLLFVGTGNPEWIKTLAMELDVLEYIEFVGALESGIKGVFPFLDSLTLYIHPSMTEGLPRVVIEAMSRGKICLASSVGGTPELLNNCFLHKPGDWKTLSHQIFKVCTQSSKFSMETSKLNLEVSSNYLESKLQQKRIDVINKILDIKL